jgi:ADP-ribose pyrophosphatase
MHNNNREHRGRFMSNQFKWLEITTQYREQRASIHGEELRWIVNCETILNTQTGHAITRATIRHPGICVIVPFLSDQQILLMRQYRYSIDDELWELPAGTLDGREENQRMTATETPLECAGRELLEETGYEAVTLEKLAECYAMPGSSDELIHIFAARNLTQRTQSLDIGEVISEIRPFNFAELKQMITANVIRDAKTLVALLYALPKT